MFAVSMMFGDGGPREWIKLHGCNFTSTPERTIEAITDMSPLGLFTSKGQTFFNDMLTKNHKNWNEGFKQTMQNPVLLAVISTMLLPSYFPQQAALALNSARIGAGGIGFLFMAVAIGIAMGVTVLYDQRAKNKLPPNPESGPSHSEYTVGGWVGNVGTGAPMTRGFNRGWVTKPIRVHSLLGWPPTQITHVENGVTINTPPPPPGFTGLQYMSSVGVNQIEFFFDHTLNGAWTDETTTDKSLAVDTYTGLYKNVPKNLCCSLTPSKIRAGANPDENELWCIDPFPSNAFADTINIGTLAPSPVTVSGTTTTSTEPGTSMTYTTSTTWTDGKSPSLPQYPFGPPEEPYRVINKNDPGAWFYQLVYDKEGMVGLKDKITTTGQNIKVGYPTHLWNTDLLRFYFLDTTIQEMRQYYCIQALAHFPAGDKFNLASGDGVHEKCWGYLDIGIPGYKYLPMTIPGEMMSTTNPTFV